MADGFPKRVGHGLLPHVAWEKFIRAALGDAFTDKQISIVGAENLAIAYALEAVNYSSEKIFNNSIPALADDALVKWAERLGIRILPTDTAADIRRRCSVQYKVSGGNSENITRDLIDELLGDAFIKLAFLKGDNPNDLESEPDKVIWDLGDSLPPGVDASDWELPRDDDDPMGAGNEVFTSQVCLVRIEVTQPSDITEREFLKLVNTDLYELLDGLLPAWAQHFWVLGSTGFILDQHRLDFNGVFSE